MATPTFKRTTSPAFQFYPKDFLSSSKVMRMSLTERGAYITLLSHCWLDGSLPANVAELARLLGVREPQFARMWKGPLCECFIEKDGRLTNPRLDDERRKQLDYRRRQSDRGKQGGRPRKATESQSDKAPAFSGFQAAKPDESFSSPSSSSFPSPKEHTERGARGFAPLHQTHKTHAACGRVCVPADLHERFVRALNRDDADAVLRTWYTAVDDEWSVGAKKDANPGGNDYQFWRDRFSEKWPPAARPVAVAPSMTKAQAWAAKKRAEGLS